MDSKKRSARDEAARYLTHRMRTEAEVRRHLADREYEECEIDEAVAELRSLRYLDDYQYALSYFEYGFGLRRGSMRIKRELVERGVERETIENAYEDFLYENDVDEAENAYSIAARDIENRGVKEIDDKVKARIARKLENLGYRSDDIIRTLSRIRTED